MDAQIKIEGCPACLCGTYHVATDDWLLSRFPTTLAVEDTMLKNAAQGINSGFRHLMTTCMLSNVF